MEITIKPIAYVHNSRKEVEDDHWGSVISEIVLIDELNLSCIEGIDSFSHLEIIFYFDKVPNDKIQFEARHPRNNPDFPKVGIFSQRGKNRPNRLGLTSVELVEQKGKTLIVRGLDAIDGTPILDIKPIMKEFLPQGEIRQPNWSTVLMQNYWD